jgi:hypothetical protein
MADFKTWFINAGGSLSQSVGITEFPGMGQGAIAINAIPVSTLKTLVFRMFDSVKMFLERFYTV